METTEKFIDNYIKKTSIHPYTLEGITIEDIVEIVESYAQYKVNELSKANVSGQFCECWDEDAYEIIDGKLMCTRCGKKG